MWRPGPIRKVPLPLETDACHVAGGMVTCASLQAGRSRSPSPAPAAPSSPSWVDEPLAHDCGARPHIYSAHGGGGVGVGVGVETRGVPAARGQAPTPQPGRRRLGRPLAYTGDPDAKDLTDAERRRIKRRVANRESARRVRQKRQEALCTTQVRLEQMCAHVAALAAQLQQAEAERAALLQQMAQLTQTKSAAAPQTDTKANAQNTALLAAGAGAPTAANTSLPDIPAPRPLAAPPQTPGPPAAAASPAIAPPVAPAGRNATVTSGGLRRGSDEASSAPHPAASVPPATPAASRIVTSAAVAAASGDGGIYHLNGVAPPPLPPSAAGLRGCVVSVTPCTASMRVTCAAPPPPPPPPAGPALPTTQPGEPRTGVSDDVLPERRLPQASPPETADWLGGGSSLDLDALPLLPLNVCF